MPNREEIKKALLAAAGNPESGAIVSVVDDMAKAVEKLLKPEETVEVSFDKTNKETRVVAPVEKR
jgi:transcription antitermination factor NusA-like protein